MKEIWEKVEAAHQIGICGHVRPDGDCVGTCMALYLYLKKNYPQKAVNVHLEYMPERFAYLFDGTGYQEGFENMPECDLFFSLDTGDLERLGAAAKIVEKADTCICIDHHISNTGFADINVVDPDSSSASQVLFELLDEKKIDKSIATALYLGIVQDSGCFQYDSTSRRTMEIAGILMEKGVNTSNIVDRTMKQKTYVQNQMLGRVLLESLLLLDGQVIASRITQGMMEFYGATKEDLEGIVEQLRVTQGTEVAIFLHEVGVLEYKVSMRSKEYVDVSKIASHFGGGGHVRAAGCTMSGTYHDILNTLLEWIDLQIKDRSKLI